MVCERSKRKEPPFMRFPRNCFQSGLFEIFMLPSESDVGGLSYDLSIKKWFLEKNRFETRKPWPRRCKYLERQMEVTAVQDLGITESVIYLSHWMLPTQLDISLRLHSDDFLKLWRQLRKNGENGCFFFCVYSANRPNDTSGVVFVGNDQPIDIVPLLRISISLYPGAIRSSRG